jgi:lipopolysaccharide export system permease protein
MCPQPFRNDVDAVYVAFPGRRRSLSICKIPSFDYHDGPVHTINRYVLREIFVPFALGLAVFTVILLIARILKLVEMVVSRGVPPLDVLRLFSYILPAFLEVTVPMALLLGVLVAFGRLSSDSEIIALKTCGISLYQLLRPVASFAIVIYFVALGLSLYARPWGNSLLHSGLYEIAKKRASAGIKEKVFNDDFSGLVIYVDHIEPPGNTLHGILISDTRDSNQRNTVIAQVGVLVPNERLHVLTLRLLNGSIHAFYPSDHSYHRTDFSTYDITLDLNTALANLHPRAKDASEMTLAELRQAIASKRLAGEPAFSEAVELQRRFSIPFACLAFAAIGIPLGIQPTRSVRSRGFTLSLGLILLYYLLLTLGESLGQRGVLPAAIALWLPNVLLSGLAVMLFVRAARETAVTQRARVDRWLLALRFRIASLAGSKPN